MTTFLLYSSLAFGNHHTFSLINWTPYKLCYVIAHKDHASMGFIPPATKNKDGPISYSLTTVTVRNTFGHFNVSFTDKKNKHIVAKCTANSVYQAIKIRPVPSHDFDSKKIRCYESDADP